MTLAMRCRYRKSTTRRIMSASGHAYTATIACASFLAGYYVCHLVRQTTAARNSNDHAYSSNHTRRESSHENEFEDDDDDDEIDIDSTALNDLPGEVRMTLIVRTDLKMGKGKAAAQCLHATLGLYEKITNPNCAAFNPTMVHRWKYQSGQAKITLQVPDQESMDIMFAQAMSMGINAHIVHDAGRTQIAAGSATVLGLGPAPRLAIDQITLELKLY